MPPLDVFLIFFFNDTATTEIYTLSLHDALPIYGIEGAPDLVVETLSPGTARYDKGSKRKIYARTGVKELYLKSTRLHSSHGYIPEDDFCMPSATHGANVTFTSALLPGLKIKTAT